MENLQPTQSVDWIAVEGTDGVERYVRAETTPAGTHPSAATARKTTNTSYAPLTRRQQAALTLLCVLGVLVTAAVGLLFMFWSYLQ